MLYRTQQAAHGCLVADARHANRVQYGGVNKPLVTTASHGLWAMALCSTLMPQRGPPLPSWRDSHDTRAYHGV